MGNHRSSSLHVAQAHEGGSHLVHSDRQLNATEEAEDHQDVDAGQGPNHIAWCRWADLRLEIDAWQKCTEFEKTWDESHGF